MYNSQDVATRIKNLCAQNKISENQMLSKCGVGLRTIQNMKTSMPSADKIAMIADYFNVSTDYLLGREKMTLADKKITTPSHTYIDVKHIIDMIIRSVKSETELDKLTSQYTEHDVDAYQLTKKDFQLILNKGGDITLNELLYLSVVCDIYLPDIFMQIAEDELLDDIPAAAKGGSTHFTD